MPIHNLRFTWRFVVLLLALAGGAAFGGATHLVTHAAAPQGPYVPPHAARLPNLPSQYGDVFAGVGRGFIDHFDSTGALIETLDTGSLSSEDTGMCVDSSGTLYTTNWAAGNMSTFNNLGVRQSFPWGGPFSAHPESCVVDASGNIYVGEVDGLNRIRKFSPTGTLLASWAPAASNRGVDWLDLAADQCTMYYTSEGSVIKRFDVCAGTQLPDFVGGLPAPCYALRIRSNGEIMVACQTELLRLDSTGTVMQTYPTSNYAGTSFLFAANLDPDGTSIWTGDYHTGLIYKIDIATGAALMHLTAPPQGLSMAGLAIYGELTQGQPTPPPGTPQPTATPGPAQPTATAEPPQPTATAEPPQPTATAEPPTATETPAGDPPTATVPPPADTPTASPTDVPRPTRTAQPTNTPRPSATPRVSPAATNTAAPGLSPSATPTPKGGHGGGGSPSNGTGPATGSLNANTAGAAPAQSAPAFTDLGPDSPFYAAALTLRDRQIVAGYPDGTFRPAALTTRGQVAKMIALAFGYPPVAGPSARVPFSDVPASNPFYPYIAALQPAQIVAGYADGTFRPNAPVTRAQLAKMIVQARHWAISTPAAPSFTDMPGNSPFFVYVETAYAHHVLSGYGTTFRPDAPATRGQVARIVVAALADADSLPTQP